MQLPHNADHSTYLRQLLKQADNLVKKHHLNDALELVRQAREIDPKNPYARAYEQRLHELLKNHNANAPDHDHHDENSEKKSVVKPQQSNRAILSARIDGMLERASQLEKEQELERAKSEIARARMLDPENASLISEAERLTNLIIEENARREERQKAIEAELARKREEAKLFHDQQLRKEREERYAEETRQRKDAMLQKIAEYLQRAETFTEEGRLDEAIHEVRFILMVDPSNDRALALRNEIANEHKLRSEHLAQDHAKRKKAITTAVQKHIANALSLAEQKLFSQALSVLARAYVFDPANEELQATELRVRSLEEDHAKKIAEQERIEEQQRIAAREETLARMAEEDREQRRTELAVEEEKRSRDIEEQLRSHLEKAGTALAEGLYDEALSEVALGFLVDPTNDEIKELELKILTMSAAGKENTIEEDDHDVNTLLSTARELRDAGDHERALDQLSRAFLLDPLNEEIVALEDEIQQEWLKKQATSHDAQSGNRIDETTDGRAERVRKLIDQEKFEDAMAEVAMGLLDEPTDEVLLLLKMEIPQHQSPNEANRNRSEAAAYLSKAREFGEKDELMAALDEVAKALVLDPFNVDALTLDEELRSQKSGL